MNNKWSTNMECNVSELVPSRITFVKKILIDSKSKRKIALVGCAGSGKTFLSRHIYENIDDNTNVIWIDRNAVVHRQEPDFMNIDDSENTLIIFDGFDELSEAISSRYAKRLLTLQYARVIITSKKNVDKFVTVAIPNLTKEDVFFLLKDGNINENIDLEHLTSIAGGSPLSSVLLASLLKLDNEEINTEIINYCGKFDITVVSKQNIGFIMSLAKSLYGKGNYNYSLQLYKFLCSLLLKSEDKRTLAVAYNDIANVYQSIGNYNLALKYGTEALSFANDILTKSDSLIATIYNNIGGIYSMMGNFSEAEKYYLMALELRERVIGEENPDIANSYSNIASIYFDTYRYEEALNFYKKALKIRLKNMSKNHPTITAIYNNMAGIFHAQCDYSKALEYYGYALDCEKVLGKEHPDTAITYNNMAIVFKCQCDYGKALEYCSYALTICEKVLGKEHPDTATTYNNMAGIFHVQGDYGKALKYYSYALAIYKKVLGKEHPDIAIIYNNMALVFHAQSDYDKALEWYIRAFRVFSNKFGIEHPNTKKVLKNLALTYSLSAKTMDFEKWFDEQLWK